MKISQWLDTQTRAILCADYDQATLNATDSFSLLLIAEGIDKSRIDAVLTELAEYGVTNSTRHSFVVRQGMTLDEAMLGQFALICCDCATAFVRDDVAMEFDRNDFHRLFTELSASPEFQPVRVRIAAIPANQAGQQFLWQFLGLAVGAALPLDVTVMRKNARLMKHCGEKIGGSLEIGG